MIPMNNIQLDTEKHFTRMSKEGDDERKQCLRWSLAGVLAAHEWGYRTCINAGSASWKVNELPAPHDDHFTYEWQGLSTGTIEQLYLSRGVLPEMHCWIAFPDEGIIYDPTTKFLPSLCEEKEIEMTCEIPGWTWLTQGFMPTGWIYKPEMDACRLANDLAQELMNECYATA